VFDSGERYAKAKAAVKAARSLLPFGPDLSATGAKRTPRSATVQRRRVARLLSPPRAHGEPCDLRLILPLRPHTHREGEKRSVPNRRQTGAEHRDTIAEQLRKSLRNVDVPIGSVVSRICHVPI
jgi:hypothetical protein